ncbi:MAG: adenylosuccinate lyase [Woeseiaceae bacterium]|nr:adenylosuccinate lyase [Woeseiaceae bacterium]
MDLTRLKALCPADGRYADKVQPLRSIFSEFGLIRFRVLIEVRWLQWLADEASVPELAPLSTVMKDMLNHIVDDFSTEDAIRVKKIESTTNHDVKAVEYFVRERIGTGDDTRNLADFIHFACTSEDINNLAYALMLRTARDEVLVPRMKEVVARLRALANEHADTPMISRTHGQAASPTTVGKEFANSAHRLVRNQDLFSGVRALGKFNGAVGNFNAHVAAYPGADWPSITTAFVESLGLECNLHTTQIEPHDWTAEYCQALIRCNTVLIDLCRDLWGYISLGYFSQRISRDEVGSSTMPHKVNPIDFENAEGNLGMANALLDHFALKLPLSRWQRDLTDSTVQRNFGVAAAYVVIAMQSILSGLAKLQVNAAAIQTDIDDSWEVLGEAIQTVMRRYGIAEPYEQLKELTRGKRVSRELLHQFIEQLEVPDEAKARLLALTPATYTGLAPQLARQNS